MLHGARAGISLQPMENLCGAEKRCEEEEVSERNCFVLAVTLPPTCASGELGMKLSIEKERGNCFNVVFLFPTTQITN